MVHVTFYNLLRSKYKITELEVEPGTIHDIIKQIVETYPTIKKSDMESSIVFYHSKPIHHYRFHTVIEDESSIIFTHFVGGG